jgi:hypothetical protein
MRKINWLVIHESDTPNGEIHTVYDIDEWHKDRGFCRSLSNRKLFNPTLSSIGYQYVIYIDGSLHTGRSEEEVPAAVEKHNHDSINICLIGKGKYTQAQWDCLKNLIESLKTKYPTSFVVGHCYFDTAKAQGKTCPDFDVVKWVRDDFVPEDKHFLVIK